MQFDTEKLKKGEGMFVVRDVNGKLHTFGGKTLTCKVLQNGKRDLDISDNKEMYIGITEIHAKIQEG